MSPRPTVAVLAAHWGSGTEQDWCTRQIAGALACAADVHVITPERGGPEPVVDSVFSLHQLDTPLDPFAELRRDLLVEGISATVAQPERLSRDAVTNLLDRDLIQPWARATPVLADLRPDLVVTAGHLQVGALAAVDAYDREVPVVLLVLGSALERVAFPRFRPMYDRARSVLTVTRGEHDAVVAQLGRPDSVYQVGVPLAANPGARSEPDLFVGDAEYVLVLTGVDSASDHPAASQARLLRTAVTDRPVAVVHDDGLFVWHQGRVRKGLPVERSSDLARLMAWARMTVDLNPGHLFARRSVESLLYGTPIVVPDDSRAREHAERGRGGLWFANPPELLWCVEAVFDAATRASLGAQGQAYAEREFGSTDRFIEKVTAGCGLPPPTATSSSSDAPAVAGSS